MRLCTYIVKKDTGLAPNPFWGYCTLAVCTPNHMGIRAKPGDWFAGFTPKQQGNKLLYTVEVSEVMPFDQYAVDPRFDNKKPVINGPWKRRCGDNMYYQDEQGKWQQRPNVFHNTPEQKKQDLRHPTVFIGERFYYFGENAIQTPPQFDDLIWPRQGCKCSHEPELVADFLDWLQAKFQPGIHGEPFDRPVKS